MNTKLYNPEYDYKEFYKNNLHTQIQESKELDSKLILIGTHAYHQLGNLSRLNFQKNYAIENMFTCDSQTTDYWLGSWITGYGFFNVFFPKETSRELTQEEIQKYDKSILSMSGSYDIILNLK